MEKTKFELDCEQYCSECMRESLDICNLPGHCKDEVELSRCGICGKVYCSEESLTEINLCGRCSSDICGNVDANNEIIFKCELSHKGITTQKVTESIAIEKMQGNFLKRILSTPVIMFPDKSFFDVKDVLIGVAVIIFFVLSQI